MHYLPAANTVDAIMRAVFTELMARPFDNLPSKSVKNPEKPNPTSEIVGVMLHLTNPRARLSRSETRGRPISALAELLWYFSKDNRTDFINYYIEKYNDFDEGGIIFGGYGPRLFKLHGKYDQIGNIIKLLTDKPSTRRAVIQIFDGGDLETYHKDVPCTCTLQFLLRGNRLNMVTSIRSNDAYLGLPHDIFAFTMLQEMVARSLNVELGEYFHSIGSLHLYFNDQDHVKEYFTEGHQSTWNPMPAMPPGNQFPQIEKLLEFESKVRLDRSLSIPPLEPYWADLARLLKIHALYIVKDYAGIQAIQKEMHSDVFNTHIDKKIETYL